MRLVKTLLVGLTVVMLSSTLTACNILRTPYERQKMAESGGSPKTPSEEGGDASSGSGGEEEGGKKKATTAGDKDKKKEDGQERVDPTRAETKAERAEREKGQGLLYVLPKAEIKTPTAPKEKPPVEPQPVVPLGEDKSPHLLYNKTLSIEVSRLEGVDGAIVLLDDHHRAYVAIHSGATPSQTEHRVTEDKQLNLKAEGDVPKTTQQRVAKQLRKSDPLVSTVHITADSTHAASFQRYAGQLENGEISGLNTQALAEHIEDIWK